MKDIPKLPKRENREHVQDHIIIAKLRNREC